MGVTGRIHSVETFGTLDGPGIRYVLFLQGCALRCLYCHNPDTWDLNAGKETDSQEVIKDILKYKNFIKTGGVTISGGEPLLQSEFVLDILAKCKENNFHTVLDTAGSVPLAVSKPVIDMADLLLLDIKAFDNDLCIKLTGQNNQNTLATLDYCEKTKKPVWIRHVLLSKYTLDFEQIEKLADFISQYSCIEKVEFLPFHKMGEFKWKELGFPYQLFETVEPTDDDVAKVKQIFIDKKLGNLLKEQ